MATVDYAAICGAIEERGSVHEWPNITRLARNRVDAASFPATVDVPLLIAARLSAEEARKGPQVLEVLVEVFDVLNDLEAVAAIDLAEPIGDFGKMAPGPVGFPLLLTPTVTLTLPRANPYLMRVKGWDGHYDFLVSTHERPA